MSRILITGGSGMLGSYAAFRAVETGWETSATYTSHPVEIPGCKMLAVDIRSLYSVMQAVESLRPDVILHTAALVRPDECEQNKPLAYEINVTGTQNVIQAAERVGAHLVHISTDLVFSGERNPIMEDAIFGPVNQYALTKAAAEIAISSSRIDSAIIRTSVIYGPGLFDFKESASDKIINSLKAGKTYKAFADQYRPAIPAWNLADVSLEIAERRLTGIFHAVCPETSTRLQFAQKVAEIFGLDTSYIEPMYMDEVETPARRPKMLVLDTTSTSRRLNTKLLGFEEGIRQMWQRK